MSYSSLPITSKLFQLTFLTCALALAGCGGGDGDTVDSIAPKPDTGIQPGTGGSTGTPVKDTNISPISMIDSAGQPTRIVTSSGATASVKVTDAKGEPISGALVTFNTDAEMSSMLFGNTNGTTLTNADGIAVMALRAVSANDTGSYALYADVKQGETEDSTPAYFYSLKNANLIFDGIAVEKNKLPYGGSTDITGLVKNSETMQSQKDVDISFAASCGTISDAKTNVLGFRATYDAGTCEGVQTIVATIGESGATIRLPITIDSRSSLGALSIQCISGDTPSFPDSSNTSGSKDCAENVVLGVTGSTIPSTRTIEFVVSQDDKPFVNERVKVELLSAPDDFGIGSARNQQPLTITTDNAGRIKVPLYAGNTQQNNIKLRATLLSRVDVTATVTNIEVVSSVPTQSGFAVTPTKNVLAATETTKDNAGELSVRKLNDSTTLNVIARDVNGGFVNGSTINFIAEGGTLSANSCVLNNGRCQVTLSTKGVIPNDKRVTVLAYTSTGDSISGGFQTFLDENENGKVDDGEVRITSTNRLVYKQFIIGFADTIPTFNPELKDITSSINGSSQKAFTMLGSNQTGNRAIAMPSATKVEVKSIDNTSANKYSCSAQLISNGVISNILTLPALANLYIPETPSFPLEKQDNSDKSYTLRTQNCDAGDEVKLTVTTPSPNIKKTETIIKVN